MPSSWLTLTAADASPAPWMTYLATRNCASSPSFQSAGTVQVGLSAAAAGVRRQSRPEWRDARRATGSYPSRPERPRPARNCTDFKKAMKAGLFFSTSGRVAHHFEIPSGVIRVQNHADDPLRIAAAGAGAGNVIQIRRLAGDLDRLGGQFRSSASSSGGWPTWPRQRLTLAVSPPDMGRQRNYADVRRLAAFGNSKLATRNCVGGFSFQPSGRVYFNLGRPELSGAGRPLGMVAGMPEGDAAAAGGGGWPPCRWNPLYRL